MIFRLIRSLLPLLIFAALAVFLWQKLMPDGGGFSWFKRDEPKVEVTHQTVLQSVEELGKLELVRYNFRDVVEYTEKGMMIDDELALIVGGEAVGCIDLRRIQQQDVAFEGDSVVRITLPAPELCYYKVDHSKSKVFNKKTFFAYDEAAIVDRAYKYADAQVKRAALSSGILPQTSENARQILKPILERLTGRRVVFTPRLQVPAAEQKR